MEIELGCSFYGVDAPTTTDNKNWGEGGLQWRRRPEATYYSLQQSFCMCESFVVDPLSMTNE
jgi:hypothetical protein